MNVLREIRLEAWLERQRSGSFYQVGIVYYTVCVCVVIVVQSLDY